MKKKTRQLLHELQQQCYGKNVSLPSVCYTSSKFLAREESKVLRRGWHCLGREDEVPCAGDFFTVNILNESLIVVRDSSLEVTVVSNVCRHRAMPVAEGSGNTVMFRCPYHAWTYELDGSLRSAPLIDAQEVENCRLPKVRAEIWAGFIFATLNPNAISLAESLADLHKSIENYKPHAMHHIGNFSEVWNCNWKSLVENFMDGYHLSVVHPESLRPLTPTRLCQYGVQGENFTSYIANYATTAPERCNHASDLTDEERRQSKLFCVFPSMVVSVSPDTLVYLALQPDGTDRVKVKWGISVFETELSREEKNKRIHKWQEINHEDHDILKNLHRGHQSKLYHGGSLAPSNLEGTVSHFHDYLIRCLTQRS